MTHACSYGVILWELIGGKTPFQRKCKGSDDLVWREGFPHLPPASCPSELEDVLRRCLAHSPNARPSWDAILAVLHGLRQAQVG